MKKFRTGAASFYIVAFSTLILVIIAASFATAIVSEVMRSSNDDLSQSAYDAALAGVEDAKLAFNNYWNCIKDGAVYDTAALSNGDDVTCQDIVYWMRHYQVEDGGCDMVGHILGRIDKHVTDSETGVPVEEGENNNMEQAYTCTIIRTNLGDYRASLSPSENYRVITPEFDEGKTAKDVAYVKFNWYLNNDETDYNYSNIVNGAVAFPSLNTGVPVPPVMSLQLIQTADTFSLQQLISKNSGALTDRAAVFLVPTDANSQANMSTSSGETYVGIYGQHTIFEGAGQKTDYMNLLSQGQIANTNDHSKDLPFTVRCDKNDEYACSTMMHLPEPINGGRNEKTFALVVALPYGQPETDFSLEFYDRSGNLLTLGRTQIAIDSTGRANDLYRRIETRLETTDNSMEFPFYALQLGGSSNGGESLSKVLTPTSEWSADQYPEYTNY